MKDYRINTEITSKNVRLKDFNEVISFQEALKRAVDNNTDLIELSVYNNNGEISVCILQDYQKFLYQQKKKAKELKANQVKVTIKEIRFGPQTDDHDYNFKLKHARKFLESKNYVKACVVFKGRELSFKDQGEILLLKLASDLNDISKVNFLPKLEGTKMSITLIPK